MIHFLCSEAGRRGVGFHAENVLKPNNFVTEFQSENALKRVKWLKPYPVINLGIRSEKYCR